MSSPRGVEPLKEVLTGPGKENGAVSSSVQIRQTTQTDGHENQDEESSVISGTDEDGTVELQSDGIDSELRK